MYRPPMMLMVVLALLLTGCGKESRPAPGPQPAPAPPTMPPAGKAAAELQPEALRMVDRDYGWALDRNSRLWRTGDGAATWNDVTPAGLQGPAAGWAAADPDHAWVSAGGQVWLTVDGGERWTVVGVAGLGNSRVRFSFADPRRGWLLEISSLAVHATRDGGATWSRLSDGPSDVARAALTPPCCPDADIAFRDGTRGYLTTGQPEKGRLTLWETNDGGYHWSPLSLPLYPDVGDRVFHVGVPTFSGEDATVVAWEEMQGFAPVRVYMTSNATDLWYPAWVPVNGRPVSFFLGARIGFVTAAAEGPTPIVATYNQGRNWAAVSLDGPLAGPVRQLQFVTTNEGWALAGPEPRIFRTTDGGKTWVEP